MSKSIKGILGITTIIIVICLLYIFSAKSSWVQFSWQQRYDLTQANYDSHICEVSQFTGIKIPTLNIKIIFKTSCLTL